jgi:hypothetical protein
LLRHASLAVRLIPKAKVCAGRNTQSGDGFNGQRHGLGQGVMGEVGERNDKTLSMHDGRGGSVGRVTPYLVGSSWRWGSFGRICGRWYRGETVRAMRFRGSNSRPYALAGKCCLETPSKGWGLCWCVAGWIDFLGCRCSLPKPLADTGWNSPLA